MYTAMLHVTVAIFPPLTLQLGKKRKTVEYVNASKKVCGEDTHVCFVLLFAGTLTIKGILDPLEEVSMVTVVSDLNLIRDL